MHLSYDELLLLQRIVSMHFGKVNSWVRDGRDPDGRNSREAARCEELLHLIQKEIVERAQAQTDAS